MQSEAIRSRRFAAATVVAVLAVALLVPPADSTIYVIPPDAELLAETHLVVYGFVEHTTVLPDLQNTDAFVRVESVLKGSLPGSMVRVRQPGSTYNRLMGLRMLRPGDTVLLFLRPEAPGVYRTVDLGLGAFFEDRGHLDRHIGESGFRNAGRFNDWIVDRVRGIRRAADYQVDFIPGPQRVDSAARWIRDDMCGKNSMAPPGWSLSGFWDISNPICYMDADGDGWWDDYEPFLDSHDGTNRQNGTWDPAEPLVEWNHNGVWDPAEKWVDNWPWNDGVNPGNGRYDPPEPWVDTNGSCYRDPGEPYTDLNGNGRHDEGDWLQDINCNQTWDDDEAFTDLNGDGKWNPAEIFRDANGNGVWDDAEETTDCLAGPYVGTNQLWDSSDYFYYEDRNGNGVFDEGDVKVTGDNVIFRYLRWQNFDPGFTLHCGVDGCLPGDYERNFSIDLDPNKGSWLTTEEKLTAVNSAVNIWKSAGSRAFTGSTLSNPLVNARAPAFDNTDYFQSFIGVEIGAARSDLGCSEVIERALLNTSSAVGADVDYTGAGEQLFVDDYGVAFYDEGGADLHSSTNKYKCTDATWDRGNGTTVGNGDLLVPGSTTETRSARCTAGTDASGYYTPGNDPRPVKVPACGNTRAIGAAFVSWGCPLDGAIGAHAIPGGGTRKAYRLDSVRIRLPDSETIRDADGLLSVLAHELGHALGIDHTDAAGTNLMNAAYNGTTSLSEDDRAAVLKLYPAAPEGGAGPSGNGGGDGPSGGGNDPPPADEGTLVAPPVPPVAAFTVDVDCPDELCRVRTGEEVHFADTSSGTVVDRSWDFGTTGRASGGRTVKHRWESPGFYRAMLTVEGADAESKWSRIFLVEASSPAGSCVSSREVACLQDSRYKVAVEWQHPDGSLHPGRLVHAGTNGSGLFSFFDGDNWEVLVKVLNGCAINGHHWVYAASATSLPFELSVTDTVTGEVYRYSRAQDDLGALADPSALPCTL